MREKKAARMGHGKLVAGAGSSSMLGEVDRDEVAIANFVPAADYAGDGFGVGLVLFG